LETAQRLRTRAGRRGRRGGRRTRRTERAAVGRMTMTMTARERVRG
jgi:hypothetical protein